MLDFYRQLGSYINQGFVIFVSCADAAQLAENLCNEQKVKFNEVLKCSNCRPPMESGAFWIENPWLDQGFRKALAMSL